MTKVTVRKNEEENGFTLIELLVVIGIIAILAAIVIVAINPSRQFAQARNAQRESNVATILNAIGQNIADNRGTFSTSTGSGTDCSLLPTTSTTIGTGGGSISLDCLVPTYIPAQIPTDPATGTPALTNYVVSKDVVGRVTVCAPQHTESAIPGSGIYCLTR